MMIDEALRRRVKLERLYDYEVVHDLRWNGHPFDGLHRDGEIYLDAALGGRAVPVYLHEVAHAIARISGLDTSPDAAAHNQYFAVLLAVMFRRAKMLHEFRLYDFCDTEAGQTTQLKNAPILSAAELTRRFRYIMRRSAQLAKTDLTIEEIGRTIFEEDAWPHWNGDGPATASEEHRPPRWQDMLIGALGGGLFTAATVAAAAAFL